MTADKFRYSDSNKRYHTYDYYLKHRFGKKVYRAAVDIGAGCPNRDGTLCRGGCIFCSDAAADGFIAKGAFKGIDDKILLDRIDQAKASVAKKCPLGPYIIYLQSGSNTYGDCKAFERAFNIALSSPNVVGLCIATRSDCINEEIADMLAEFAEKTYLTVELGLQTIHDETAHLCRRGHSYEQFLEAYDMLTRRGINIGTHIINGLPNETREMMLQTACELSKLKLHCLKIHMLYVESGTPIEQLYNSGRIKMLTREEYVDIVCSQIEMFSEDVIIARLTGDGIASRLIAPQWSMKKLPVMNEIDKEFARRGSMQGAAYRS